MNTTSIIFLYRNNVSVIVLYSQPIYPFVDDMYMQYCMPHGIYIDCKVFRNT